MMKKTLFDEKKLGNMSKWSNRLKLMNIGTELNLILDLERQLSERVEKVVSTDFSEIIDTEDENDLDALYSIFDKFSNIHNENKNMVFTTAKNHIISNVEKFKEELFIKNEQYDFQNNKIMESIDEIILETNYKIPYSTLIDIDKYFTQRYSYDDYFNYNDLPDSMKSVSSEFKLRLLSKLYKKGLIKSMVRFYCPSCYEWKIMPDKLATQSEEEWLVSYLINKHSYTEDELKINDNTYLSKEQLLYNSLENTFCDHCYNEFDEIPKEYFEDEELNEQFFKNISNVLGIYRMVKEIK